jgi:phenylacetate-CoA ligase
VCWRFSPREVWTGGETLGPWVRRHIEQALGCTVRNSYRGFGISDHGLGMRAWPPAPERRLGHSGTQSTSTDAAPSLRGCPHASTLLTHLANTVQPLIRYDLGDQVTVFEAPCACGSAMPVIEVQGRRDDARGDDRARRAAVTILPLALTTVIEEQAGVYDFQLRQIDASTLLASLARRRGCRVAGKPWFAAAPRCSGLCHRARPERT